MPRSRHIRALRWRSPRIVLIEIVDRSSASEPDVPSTGAYRSSRLEAGTFGSSGSEALLVHGPRSSSPA